MVDMYIMGDENKQIKKYIESLKADNGKILFSRIDSKFLEKSSEHKFPVKIKPM